MFDKNKIVIAQLNSTVGDLEGNSAKIIDAYRLAVSGGADLVITPADALTGTPIGDLANNPNFKEWAEHELWSVAYETGETPLVMSIGKDIYNLKNGVARKSHDLYIGKGTGKGHAPLNGKTAVRVAFDGTNGYLFNPGLYISLDTEPFRIGGVKRREKLARQEAHLSPKCDIVWVNRIGGDGENIFDGGSFAMSAGGEKIFEMPRWEEVIGTVAPQSKFRAPESEISEMYNAAIQGLRDYYVKNGFFKGVLLGLSGGLDSALVFAIAAAALGADSVRAVAMPSKFTEDASNSLANEMCRNYGVDLRVEPIDRLVDPFRKALDPKQKITDENLQARVRGMLLMGISNDENRLLLATSNKSEVAAGYGTLYGDMCGGYNPVADIYKTDAYKIAKHINEKAGREMIPAGIIERAPSAELSPGQKDSDSLPPYPVLDKIVKALLDNTPVHKIDANPDTVFRVAKMMQNAEFKRRQACPGPNMSKRSFADTNMPVLNKFKLQRGS